MLSGAVLSLFMNNIAAMAVLLPATMGLSRQVRMPPSRLLMPLAYGVVAGGMATLFTTSNIIASSALRDAGLTPFGVLDFIPIGIPLVLIVIIYIILIGRRLLPVRDPADRPRFSPSAGRTIAHLRDGTVLVGDQHTAWFGHGGFERPAGCVAYKNPPERPGIARNGTFISAPSPETVIREKDIVLVQGEPPEEALVNYGLRVLDEAPVISQATNGDAVISEIVLPPHSKLVGKTLREINFREKFRLTVLAMWRAGKPVHMGFASLPLEVGDGLLVQGTAANLRMLYRERDFIVLEEDPEGILRPQKARLATMIGLVTLLVAITGWLPIALVSLAGAAAMILTGCLSMDEAYQSIDWRAIFLIAGMWPLSTAIQTSGLSGEIVGGLEQLANTTSH